MQMNDIQARINEALTDTPYWLLLLQLSYPHEPFESTNNTCLMYLANIVSSEFSAPAGDRKQWEEADIERAFADADKIIEACNLKLWPVGLCIDTSEDDIAERMKDNSFSCYVHVGLVTRNMPKSLRDPYLSEIKMLYEQVGSGVAN